MPLTMKSLLKYFLILGTLALFWWMNTATSKVDPFFPCENSIMYYLSKDSVAEPYYLDLTHDTVLIKVHNDTLLDHLSTGVCNVLKDSCKMQGFKILITDTTSDPAQWNTPYGKQVFFRICP